MVWIGARGREKLEEELAGKRSPFAISSRVGGEAVPNESSTKRTKFLRDPGPWEHVVSRRDPKRGAFLLCAAAIVPLVLRTLYLGLKRLDVRHRRIARWTFPLWMYVDVTGVVIYVMLYHLYPHGPIRVR